jgi:hypothetical protein
MHHGRRRCAYLTLFVVGGLLGLFGATPASASPTGIVLMQVTQNIGGGTCQLGSVDLATGVVTPLPHVAGDVCLSDLAYSPDGRLFGLESNLGQPAGPIHLFQLDPTTGQVAADLGQVGTFNAFADPTTAGLALDASGTMFVAMNGQDPSCNGSSTCLYRASLTNLAAAQFVGAAPTGAFLGALAISCPGAAFTINGLAGVPNSVLESRNLSTAAVSPVGSGFGVHDLVVGLDFDATGTLWGVGTTDDTVRHVFTLDTTTGVGNVGPVLAGATGDPVSLALSPCSAPAPPPQPLVVVPRFTG